MTIKRVSDFPTRLKEALGHRSLTDFASQVGLSKQTISAYVKGTRSPKKPTLLVIARTLAVSTVWLLGYDVPKECAPTSKQTRKDVNALAMTAAFADNLPDDYVVVLVDKNKKQKEFVLSSEDFGFVKSILKRCTKKSKASVNAEVKKPIKPIND